MGALYTTQVHVTGGRNGHAKSKDGLLDIDLALAKELGGKGGATNPEQLFAAGYAACFESALRLVAQKQNIEVADVVMLSTVSLHANENKGFKLSVILDVSVYGVEQRVAEELVNKAHEICPYSNAIRGNVDVEFKVSAK